MTFAVATALTGATVWAVIRRPFRLGSGTIALLGALLAGLLHLIQPADVWQVARLTWDATVSLIAIIIMAALLEQAGFFRLAALALVHALAGQARRLFLGLIALTALVAALYTNDAAVLILTPIACEMAIVLGWETSVALPYLMAVGFVADTFSVPFTTSNLVNIMSADFAHLAFGGYAHALWTASLASLAASTAVLWLLYRRQLPRAYDSTRLPAVVSAVRDRRLIALGAVVLPLEMAGLSMAPHWHVPTAAVLAAGALILAAASLGRPALSVGQALATAPWQVIFFAIGMFLVVEGLARAGLSAGWARLLQPLAGHPQLAVLAQGLAAGLLASLVNNLPSTMLGLLGIDAAHLPPSLNQALVLANVVGNDIGPKLTPIGSLATLLWLDVLQRYGYRITAGAYLRAGLFLTPPVLVISLLALAVFG